MKAIKGRSARRRTSVYALEFLEGRALLSHVNPAAAVSGIHAEASKVVTTITGNIVGSSASAPTYSGVSYGYHGFSGHGSSSIGRVLFGMQYGATPEGTNTGVLAINIGSAQLTTLKGKVVDLNFSGTSTAEFGDASITNLTGTVVSGTGQFSGETGTFFATGTTHANGRFTLSLNITLNPATA